MKKYRLRLFIYICILFSIIGVLSFSSVNYWKQIYANKKMKSELEVKYSELLENEEILEGEVVKLQDPEYVAKFAREKYSFSKEGEIIIKFEEDE